MTSQRPNSPFHFWIWGLDLRLGLGLGLGNCVHTNVAQIFVVDIIHRLLTFASRCDSLSSVMFPLYRAMVQQRIVVNIIIINCTLLILDLNLLQNREEDFHRSSQQDKTMKNAIYWGIYRQNFISLLCCWLSAVSTVDTGPLRWRLNIPLPGTGDWSSHLVWALRPLERVKGPGNYFIQSSPLWDHDDAVASKGH